MASSGVRLVRTVDPKYPTYLNYTIVYRGRSVGSLEVEIPDEVFIVETLKIDETGVVSRGFLKDLHSSIRREARELGCSKIEIASKPSHWGMYGQEGFHVAGSEGLISDSVIRDIKST